MKQPPKSRYSPHDGENEHDRTVDRKESRQPHCRFQFVSQKELLKNKDILIYLTGMSNNVSTRRDQSFINIATKIEPTNMQRSVQTKQGQ